MANFRTLGGIDLSDVRGETVDATLVRGRRLALLAYLAVESRQGFVRRNSLLGVFWPGVDRTKARAALRQSLYVLRQDLGDDAIITRGDDEVRTGPGLVCDAAKMLDLAAAGNDADALALYQGTFLDGLTLDDAPEFERWVRDQRQLLERTAADCRRRLGAPEASRAATANAAPTPRARISWSRSVLVAAAAVVGIVGIVGVRQARTSTAADDDVARRLAVMPFTVRGGPEVAYLGEGMVDLLSARLDGPELYRAVSPAAVLHDARTASSDPANVEAARRRARGFGADFVVTGGVIEAMHRIRIEATMYTVGGTDAADQAPLSRAVAEGPADSAFAIVDRLATLLIAPTLGSGPAGRLHQSAALATNSIEALRAYLGGERQYREGAFEAAVASLRRAVAADSTFAPAYFRLSVVETWLHRPVLARADAAKAVRYADRLPARDRPLLAAHNHAIRGDVTTAEREYHEVLRGAPDESQAWLGLGELLFHKGPQRGGALTDAREPFARALGLDPDNRAALAHLIFIEAAAGDIAAVDSLAARIRPSESADESLGLGLLLAAVHHDAGRAASLIAAATGERDAVITDAARGAFMYAGDDRSAVAVLGVSLAPARTHGRRAFAHLQMAAIEMSRGHRAAAHTHFRAAAAEGYDDAARGLEALYAMESAVGDSQSTRATLASVRASLRGSSSGRQSATGPREQLELMPVLSDYADGIRLALLGQVSVRLGDTAAARTYARQLERLPTDTAYEPLRQVLLHTLDARLQLAGGHADRALPELIGMDEGPLASELMTEKAGPWSADQRFVRAEVLVALGRAKDAVPLYGSFEYHKLFTYPMVAPALLREAEALDAAGDRVGAATCYERFVGWWSGADAEYQPVVTRARRRAVELRQQARD